MKKLTILSSLLLVALNSCSNEEIFNDEMLPAYEKRITVVAEDLTSSEGTRTSYTNNGNGYSFAWSEGDALGIFPVEGLQTEFPINNDSYGSNTAIFDGGKWALRPEEKYAAYYPLIREFDLNPNSIPISYLGQVQIGNGSTEHLAKFDYMASTFTEVDAKGNVNFLLKHLGSLVEFELTMPEEDSYSTMDITSDNIQFITSGKYNLSDNNHDLYDVQKSNKVTIGLKDVSTTAQNKILKVVAMFAPVDLKNSVLTLKIKGQTKNYIFEVKGQDLGQGIAVTKSSEEETIPYVTFRADKSQTLSITKAVDELEYSVNNSDWQLFGTTEVLFGGTNGELKLRGKYVYGTTTNSNSENPTFVFSNRSVAISCRGDIRTLVDYENYSTVNTSNSSFTDLFHGCSTLISCPELPATKLAPHCYENMFYGCTSLTAVPELPALSLENQCYDHMFCGCSSLTTAPELPATKLKQYCYNSMFQDCTSLTNAPELPATTLAYSCYQWMFYGCTSLTKAPKLPAPYLDEDCYWDMFYGCTSLTEAPELPATVLKKRCYWNMFEGCTSLTKAPELPATTLAEQCYINMFKDCTSLTNAPELPATTLVDGCYSNMFNGCTSLTNAPELPATTLAENCYYNMFNGCSSLVNVPDKLPAIKLAKNCYSYMFYKCTSLVSAPELPATTLVDGCYYEMFNDCSSLNYVKMLATDIPDSSCILSWLSGVSRSGTFVKNPNAIWENYWEAYIPTSWVVVFNGNIYNSHAFVDLGLKTKEGNPIYWATTNIGTYYPWESGYYFAWGETVGYRSDGNHQFSWNNYKWYDRYYYDEVLDEYCGKITKYCVGDCDLADWRKSLELMDDAANVNWGGKWRMPSKEEFDMLNTLCTWTPITKENRKCYEVKGPNGNSIILPLSGFIRFYDDEEGPGYTALEQFDTKGSYWTSNVEPKIQSYYDSYYAYLESFPDQRTSSGSRCGGLPIRPVVVP